ncbi:MAG TPA: ABC transporter permease [Candidatus Angelobacter sp.]
MRRMRALLLRFAGLLGMRRSDAELAEELDAHVAMHVEDNVRVGMNPVEARRQALMKMGGAMQCRELYRDQTRLPMVETLLQDLRYGARMLRKNPGFAMVAIVTLALGIGANTAIFSVVNGVLLRPLPYKDPAQLMAVYSSAPAKGVVNYGTSPPDFRTLREQNRSFTSLSAFYGTSVNLTGLQEPERLAGRIVSAEYFSTLGVQPFLGRNFLPGEEKWDSHRVVIVSYGFWRSHLNADPHISGKTLKLDGEPYNLIGVMPAGFRERNPDIAMWAPMAWKRNDDYDSHNNYFLNMMGRLKPGVTKQQAYSDLNAIMLSIAQQFPENKGISADLKPLHEAWVGDTRPALMVLLGAVGLVLLMACVNLANLLLARSAGRQKEIAIRSALGADRGRLLRQFITESVMLSLLGGSLGLALAYLSQRLLPLAKDVLPLMTQIRLDGWVLLFTLGISLLTGVLFGLIPALQNSRSRKLNESLKEGGRTSEEGGGRSRLRAGLVISEVALAMVLLIGSGLAIRSFQRILRVDAGFDSSGLLTFAVNLPQSYDPQPDPMRIGAPPKVAEFYQQLLQRMEQIPGVKAAGATSSLPLQGENWGKLFAALDRPLPTSFDDTPHIQYRPVAGDYFKTLGIRLLKGRLLDESDQANTALSVVVNQTLAQKFWPGQDPIGKLVLLSPPENLIPSNLLPPGYHVPKFTVVGVVADAHYGSLDSEAVPVAYASIRQHDYSMSPSFVVQTDGDPRALISSVRSALAQVDKTLPMADVTTMDEIMSASVAQPRLEAVLLGLFGALAMLLAAVGIYGVMSYSVSERTGEIGIRVALGANPGNILRMVCKQGLTLTGIGLAAGLGLALGLTRLMSKVLFGVSPTDPLTFVVIAVLLAMIALLACWVPARRATKVDPLVALRYE